nr:23S rRNA (guanosine(2251)-2'-O)-methyltransferase RlmB [Metamycoplasma neophronis]
MKLICGKNSVLEALQKNYPIKTLYLRKGLVNRAIKFKNIVFLDGHQMDKMTRDNHQGYIAEVEDYQYYDLGTIFKDKPENVLVLDHIQDPQNFGAIIRSANVFGIKHIIIPKDRACDVTSTVMKVSSGGFRNVKIIKVSSVYEACEELKRNGFWVYVSALNPQANKLHQVKFAKPTCLVVGNEEKGVSGTLIKHADEVIYIEQKEDAIQSLNVASATSIILYEATKQ